MDQQNSLAQQLIVTTRISDPTKVRILLYQKGNISHASMNLLFEPITQQLKDLEQRVKKLEDKGENNATNK